MKIVLQVKKLQQDGQGGAISGGEAPVPHFDNSTADFPAGFSILRPHPADLLKLGKKKKREELYEEISSLTEENEEESAYILFDDLTDTLANSNVKNKIKLYKNKNSKSQNVIITFPKYQNVEVVFSLDELENNKRKFRIIISCMPFSQFKYSPLDTMILQTSFQSTFEYEQILEKCKEFLETLLKSIATISKALAQTKNVENSLKQYIEYSLNFKQKK